MDCGLAEQPLGWSRIVLIPSGIAKGVAHRLSRGLGIPCEAIEGQGVAFGGRERSVLVVFVNGLGGAECLWVLEHTLAVDIAGAFLHHAPDSLLSARQEDRLPGPLVEALREFLESSLPSSGNDLCFGALHVENKGGLGPDVEALLFDSPRTEDLQLTLQGYGSGRLTVLGA